jgi:hypothetical protein
VLKLHKQQKGFSAIEALLITLVVAIVGGTGYYVWHANHNSDNTYSSATKSATSSPEKKAVAKPLYSSGEIALYNLADLANTSDEKGVVQAMKVKCDQLFAASPDPVPANKVVVVGIKTTFSDSSVYASSGGFARMSTRCASTPVQPEDGGGLFVFRKVGGTWQYLFGGQAGASCSDVDHLHVPSVIVNECYDDNTNQTREPVF